MITAPMDAIYPAEEDHSKDCDDICAYLTSYPIHHAPNMRGAGAACGAMPCGSSALHARGQVRRAGRGLGQLYLRGPRGGRRGARLRAAHAGIPATPERSLCTSAESAPNLCLSSIF